MTHTVAIAGATGVVGQELLALLASRDFPVGTLRLMASARSAGRTLSWRDQSVVVEALDAADFTGVDIAFFSCGSERAPVAERAAAQGALVIDNSSAFRLHEHVPLVVPQVNGHALDVVSPPGAGGGIIANPNCSTILLVMVLGPILRHVEIERLVVSTYQAVSGSGQAALDELRRQGEQAAQGQSLTCDVYPVPIHENVIPFVQAFGPDDVTTEETKLVLESRRLLGRPGLAVTTTCVRVPVLRAHSEAVNLQLAQPVDPAKVRAWLRDAPGVTVWDDPPRLHFPTPRDAAGGDDVLVGRIRRDPSHPRGLDLWLTGDQLRKGAALNAIEIAEALLARTARVS